MIGAVKLLNKKGIDTSDSTASQSDILSGKVAYIADGRVSGTMANQGSKTITPSTNTQNFGAGYYSSVTVNAQTGINVNGTTTNYTAGGSIGIGKFVKLVSNKVYQIASSSDIVFGIAKTAGISDSTVSVIKPNT